MVLRSYFQSLNYVDTGTVKLLQDRMNLQPETASDEVAVHFRFTRNQFANGTPAPEHAFQTVLPLNYYRDALRRMRHATGARRFRVFSGSG